MDWGSIGVYWRKLETYWFMLGHTNISHRTSTVLCLSGTPADTPVFQLPTHLRGLFSKLWALLATDYATAPNISGYQIGTLIWETLNSKNR